MRRTITSCTTALILFFVGTSSAHAIMGVKYGVDVTVTSPMSSWGDGAGLGIGVMGRLEVNLPGPLSVTGRAGYTHHLEKANITFSTIPVLVGVKFGMGLPGVGLYGYMEGGLFRMTVSGGGFSITNSEIGGTLGLGATVGPLDARVGIVAPELAEITDAYGIMGSVGYNF